MSFKRVFIPIVLILTVLIQFLPGPLFAPRPVAAAACDWADFVADVTVPDGTIFSPGAAFTKTWRLKNIGTCTWSTSYAAVYFSGDQMGAPTVVNLTSPVAPGGTLDVTVNMVAPTTPGHYRSYWKMRNASGVLFGLGPSANAYYLVDINVAATYTTAYDFVANYCSANWTSGSGALPCPGTDGDTRGFVTKLGTPQLENGSIDSNPGLLVAPQAVAGGFIQAFYPAFTVQAGDRFQTLVNCYYNALNCFVNFRLDYQIGSGAVKTFWTFKERYEGSFFRANLDLSSLAGQNVNFILYMADVSGRGTPSGDRALWGETRIARFGSGPAVTPVPIPTTPAAACDKAAFMADVTIPDGTTLAPGAAFTKTWRLKNVGTCTWTTSYALVFYFGNTFGAPATISLPAAVAPGQTADLSINMTAPTAPGTYFSYWRLRNATGNQFGVGTGMVTFYAEIKVVASYSSVYDFAANACSATWTSGAGVLPCPGTDGDAKGFVLGVASPKLEDGSTGAAGLLVVPQNTTGGFVQGIYPAFTVQSGDRFQSTVNCAFGATACYVAFRLDYQIGSGAVQTLKVWKERNEGLFYNLDIPLASLAGQNVKFILYLADISGKGVPSGDRAVWSGPRITRSGVSASAASTATVALQPTATVAFSNWLLYTNSTAGFQLKYPPGGQLEAPLSRIWLPIAPGTNLVEKYLDISVIDNPSTCKTTMSGGNPSATPPYQMTINGIVFLVENGQDAGMSQYHDWVAYSTQKGTTCVSLGFVLHSTNTGVFTTPPPVFDRTAESAVFGNIVSTFGWLNS
jgi:hypothetical protein